MLIALIGAHCYFDYAGQGDFMAKAKNESAPINGVPWHSVMWAHCSIHGAVVALITGIWWLGVLEYCSHVWADRAKCQGRISFSQDQLIHVLCKFAWFGIALVLA